MNTAFYQILTLNKIREKYQLDPNKWLNTLPRQNTNNLVSQTIDRTNDQKINQSIKKYSLTIILFVVGLILVSVIKNETRNLQKEISNLRASINIVEHDLHQTIDRNVIIPLMDQQAIESFKSQTNNIPYGICTDYPSLLVNFYE